MKKYTIMIILILFSLSLSSYSGPVYGAAAPYYKGKVINIIVGYNPGGGYDRVARLLAKHLPKHIPGNPVVLVQNMPGASSMIAANHIYNIAKPNGLTIGAIDRGLAFAQLLKAEGSKFDLRKFAWIGSAAVESTVLILRTELPYKNIDDIAKAKSPLMIGNLGNANNSTHFLLFQKEFLGYNYKFITYPAAADAMLAMERKEVDGMGVAYSTAKLLIDRGVAIPVIRGRVSEAGIEKLPVDEDLTKDKKAKTLMAMRSAPDKMGRPYVAPPGTPEPVMNILRNAFARVAKDPELQADARNNKMTLTYVSEKDVQNLLQYILNQPPEMVTEFSKYIKF
jgi:tripartite-type tricarboxylate transporter receptor subunit TctC